MPGAEAAIWMGNAATFPLLLMPRTAGPAPASYGICRLICPGETKYSGAVTPFTVAETPWSESGRGRNDADWVEGARFVPNTLQSIPGAITAAKDAPLAAPVMEVSEAGPTIKVTGIEMSCGTASAA